MIKNQRGEGIISVLISIAILGILIVTVVTLYQLFGTMMAKSLMRREADIVANRLRGMLMQRTLCKDAFGISQSWDGNTQTNVRLRDGANIYQPGFPLASGRLVIQSIFLRKKYVTNAISPSGATNEGVPVKFGTVDYRSYPGEVVLRFSLASDMTGTGLITDRTIPVFLTVNPGDTTLPNRIVNCDINDESSIAFQCDVAKANLGEFPCQRPGYAPPSAVCVDYPYVRKIDAYGEPVCACETVCPQPMWRGQQWTTSCVTLQAVQPPNVPCPLGPGGAPKTVPHPNTCYGYEGVTCQWKDLDPINCPNPARPYAVWRAHCKVDFTN